MTHEEPTTPDDQRVSPSDLDTEQAVLGSALVSTNYREEVLGALTPEDFYRTAHQRIFRAIRACHEVEPEEVNHISVAFELKQRETLSDCGGTEYLKRIEGEYMTTAHSFRHIERLRTLTALREAMKFGGQLYAEAEAMPDDPLAFIGEAVEELQRLHEYALAAAGPGYTTAEAAAELLGEITWTWHPWIPNGFLTLLGGETGIGKSKLALRIVESVVRPRAWPNGDRGPEEAATVLYVDTEGAQGMQLGRMKAAGLPMERIFFPGDDGNRHLTLDDPTTIPFVRQTCEREGIKLVVIDSLRSGMPGDENSSEFGEKLQPWGGLARDLDIPIVIVHHANKSLGDREMDLNRIRGSSAITALPRSIIAIDRPDETVDQLRIKQVKSNLAKMAEPFGVELTEHGCDPAPVPRSPRTDFKLAEAEDWLRDILRDGPVQSGEIRERADEDGVARRTLYRARDEVGINELPDPNNPRKRLWALAARPEDEARE